MKAELVNSTPAKWWALLGLVLVPLLVAGGFLIAGVNSDARLHTVQAAVVNLDEPVTIDDQYTPLGRQLTANLVDSDRQQNFTWVLADEADARAGLATGEFAAMVVIPPNFSAAATSFSENDGDVAEQATIEVHTSPVAGVADGTLGKIVANEAATTLNQMLTESYLEQIYIGFNDMGDQFVTMADGANELADGSRKLADGIAEAADGSGQLYSGTRQLADGLDEMAAQTKRLPADVRKLADGTADYVAGVNQVVDQTIASLPQQVELAAGVKQLAAGASGLSGGLQAYQGEMAKLGSNNQVVGAAVAAAKQAADASVPCQTFSPDPALQAQLCAVFQAGRDAGAEVGANVGVNVGGQAAAAGLEQKDPNTGQSLLSGAAALAGGLGTLSDSVSAGLPDVDATTKQLKQLKAGGKQLAEGTDELADGLPELVDGIAQAASGAGKLADGVDEFSAGLITAADGGDKLADGMREMADGIADGKDKLPSYSASDRENLSTVVAAPVATDDLTGLANVNIGWISLVLVLALWLGALATYAVVKPIAAGLLSSAEATPVLIGRALLPGIVVAVLQALAVAGLAQFGLGLPAQKWFALAGVLLLAGVTFAVLNHALASWAGGLGRLVAVGLAVLTAADGFTSAAPGLITALRPFSPLTPALDALRAIATESTGATTSVLVLVGWLLLGVVASSIAIARRRTTSLEAVLAVR